MNQVISIPASGITVYINNRDRTNTGESAFNFTVPPLDTQNNTNSAYNVIIKQVIVEHFIPNVQTNVSDSIQFTIDNNVRELTLVEGFYDAVLIAQSVDTFLKTFDPGFAVGYDLNSLKMFITVPAGHTLMINRPIVFTAFVQQDSLNYPSKYDRFLEMMGMIENTGVNYSNTTFVGSNPCIVTTAFVDVNFTGFGKVIHSCGKQFNTRVRVPMSVNYGERMHHEPGLESAFHMDQATLRNLRITLVDQWGNMMKVPKGTLVALSLLLIPIE